MPVMRRRVCLPFLFMLFLALPARAARAQTGSPVSNIIVDYQFGEQIRIQGLLSPEFLEQALSIQLEFSGDSRKLTADLQPDASGTFTFVHEIADRFVSPFSTVTFSFILAAEDGSIRTS